MAIITSKISLVIGFIVGYAINALIFLIIIQTSTMILNLKSGSISIIIVMFVVKLLLYALGFFLAVKLPDVVNIIAVLIGYFVIKITIYFEGHKNKGGDLNA